MKLLLLLSLVGLAVGQAIYQKPVEVNEDQPAVLQEAQQPVEDLAEDKKINKRSYGWSPWIWPSYGWSGHGYGGGHGWGHGWGGHGHSYGWPSYGWVGYPWWYGGHGWHGHGWRGW